MSEELGLLCMNLVKRSSVGLEPALHVFMLSGSAAARCIYNVLRCPAM